MSQELNKLNPVVSYSNSETQKSNILQENKGKSGVYRWINLVNGLTYIGSAVRVLQQTKYAYFSTGSKLNKVTDPNNNSKGTNNQPEEVSPIAAKYTDAFRDKSRILKDNINKVGIYRWVNKANSNSYVGSSVNLGRRLRNYYDFTFISSELTRGQSRIYNAILKHGYSNFQLEILEYCTAENAITRVSSPARRLKRGDYLLEQYYINLFKPEYNINLTAGSRFGMKLSYESRLKMSKSRQGRKHTEDTKNLISQATKGINKPNFGKITSEETKALISAARLGKSYLPESSKAKLSEESATAIAVRVIDLETNETSVYRSIKKAANAMGVTQPPLSVRLKKTQGSFIVKNVTK